MLKTKTVSTAQEKQPEPLFKAPQIALRLKEAETNVADIELRHQQAAFDSVSDVPGSADILATTKNELKVARETVATLRDAHKAALEKDERERRRILAEHNKTIIRVCRSHLAARDTAAERLSVALVEAIAQYKIMVERGGKAKAAVPDWGLSRGKLVDSDELYRLVQQEIARLYGIPPSINGDCPFPGGNTHDIHTKLQPELLAPLADTLSAATAGIIENLTGKEVE